MWWCTGWSTRKPRAPPSLCSSGYPARLHALFEFYPGSALETRSIAFVQAEGWDAHIAAGRTPGQPYADMCVPGFMTLPLSEVVRNEIFNLQPSIHFPAVGTPSL